MPEAWICDAVRTPIGRYGGALAAVRSDDLGAIPIRALVERNTGLDPQRIDDLVYGLVTAGTFGWLWLEAPVPLP